MQHTNTIKSVCATNPQHQHIKKGDTIRWKSTPAAQYELHLPGGYFQGYGSAFRLPVPNSGFSAILTVVAVPPASNIVNYVFDTRGNNCLLQADGPPDIIIDSTGRPKRVRKKKAPAKKKS